MRQSEAILESARFRSIAILIDFEGTVSKADVRIGRGVDNSIETSSQIMRSRFHGAVSGPRSS